MKVDARRSRPPVSTLRLASIRKLLEDRRGAGLAGATLVDEEERCFRAALPSILEPNGRPVRPGLAVSWAELWTPALLAKRGAAWVEELAARHLARPRRLKADALGRLLELLDEERARLRITTIGAIDKSKRRRTADRKRKDRERKRLARAARGATPRDLSLSAVKPWEELGISRRTWERRRARGEPAPDAMTQKRPQQDTLRVSTPSPADEFATTARGGGPLRGSPSPGALRSGLEGLGSLPVAALAARELLRSRSFMLEAA